MTSALRTGGDRARRAMIMAVAVLCLGAAGAITSPARAAGADPGYISSSSLGRISTFATDTNTLGSSAFSTSSPQAMAITPNGATLYVCNSNSGTVTPIALATGATGGPITVGTNPSAIAITPDGSKAYVANAGSGTVTAINLSTGATSTIRVGATPSGVAITPDGSKAYVANQYDGTVTPITIATNTARPAIVVGTGGNVSKTSALAITPDGRTVYAINNADNSVVPITVATNTAGKAISGLTTPTAIAITPDGTTAYIAEDGSPGHLVPMNLSTHTLGAPVMVGLNPVSVAITPDQRTAYVANSGGGWFTSVTPVSLGTGMAGPPIWTLAPSSIVISPDQAPVASFSVTPAAAGSPSSFDASASSVSYGSITSYFWNFGDGQTTTTTTPTTTHTFAAPGLYTTTVTETDSAGTSTAQVFTGQTTYREGAASARTGKQVQIPSTGASAPPVALKGPNTVSVTRNGQLVVTIYCPAWAIGSCRGLITLQRLAPRVRHHVLAEIARCGRGCRVLGGTPYAARAGHKVAARIHVSADISRLLRAGKPVRAKLTVTNVVGGAPFSTSKTVVLRRRKHRHA